MGKRFDPRDHELDRREGWHHSRWVEFVLYREENLFIVTMLVDGDLRATVGEDSALEDDLISIGDAAIASMATFEVLVGKLLPGGVS